MKPQYFPNWKSQYYNVQRNLKAENDAQEWWIVDALCEHIPDIGPRYVERPTHEYTREKSRQSPHDVENHQDKNETFETFNREDAVVKQQD